MIIVEGFGRGGEPRAPPSPKPATALRFQDPRNRLTPPSPAPEPRFRSCLAVAWVPAKAPAASSIRPKPPNRPWRQRQTDKLAAAIVAPADSARERISNTSRRPVKSHRRQPPRGFLPGRLSGAGSRSACEWFSNSKALVTGRMAIIGDEKSLVESIKAARHYGEVWPWSSPVCSRGHSFQLSVPDCRRTSALPLSARQRGPLHYCVRSRRHFTGRHRG
jgi:hypothetical protein